MQPYPSQQQQQYPPQQQYPQQGAPNYGPPAQQYPPQQAPAPQYQQPAPQQAAPAPGAFAAPVQAPQGDRANAGTLVNKLLIVIPTSFKVAYFPPRPEVTNPDGTTKEAAKGPSDAIEVNLVDLDDRDEFGQPGKIYLGVMWGNKVLRDGLARQLGQPVLAKMGLGASRGGNAAPFILIDQSADPMSVQRANEFMARRPNWQSEPSTQAAPPAPPVQQYQQQAPAPQYQPQQPMQGMPPQPGPYGAPPQQYPPQYPQQAPPAPGPYGAPPQQGAPAGYMAGGPTGPEAGAAYQNMQAQQAPGQWQQQGPPPGYPQQ